MSPQIISNVLNQTWFVSTHMKEMARSVAVFEMSKLLNLLNGLQNAAAKFIRKTCHQKNLIFLIYCLVISTHCIKYVHCDIEPQPVNNNFNDDDDDSATNILNSQKHLPPINKGDRISTADSINKSNNNNNLDVSFLHAFVASLSVIVVSELGDKTFFIAAIMAMRHPRIIVFIGAISALALMTILSAALGKLANVIPHVYTYYISTALFAIFGLKMLRDGYYMSPSDAQEELEEVQSDLKKREDEFEKDAVSTTLLPDVERGALNVCDEPQVDINTATSSPTSRKPKQKGSSWIILRVIIQAFSMTFLAEWGDRSQLTTMILAFRENVYGLIVGGILGHSICTGLAVIGGRMIAQRISVRTVTIIGGIVFLVFAFSALFINPHEEKTDVKP